MGLDAFVRCNCWQEGRTTVPPVPLELLYMDQRESKLTLTLPWKGNEEMYRALSQWEYDCCDHRNMEYAAVRISNWAGVRLFQQTITGRGQEKYPILLAGLPNLNGGQMSSVDAAKALEELRHFREHAELGQNVFLVDEESGDEIHEYVADYGGIFAFDGNAHIRIGFDRDGIFVQDTHSPSAYEVFRARRVAQHLPEPPPTAAGYRGSVELVNLDNDERFVCPMAIQGLQIPWPDGQWWNPNGGLRFAYPRRLGVIERKITATDFAYITKPLEEIFRASVAIDTPVQWT